MTDVSQAATTVVRFAAVDETGFRQAMRGLAGGVAVVTSGDREVFAGMTATAICSVSTAPPLVLATLNRASNTHATICRTGVFALNLLREDQVELAARFAASSGKPVDIAAHRPGVTGCPILDDVGTTIECVLHDAHEAGTHTIFIGAVVRVERRRAAPLVFFDGRYARLSQEGGATG